MGLILNILSSGAQPGRQSTFPMEGEAMTLGRAETNDVVLPDPTREISSSHAVIQFRSGDYVIVDTSTNGTFLNGEVEPLGDLPTPLNQGDVLRIGGYEMRVDIAAAAQSSDPFADLPPPLGEEPVLEDKGSRALDEIGGVDTSGGDFLDDLLGAAPPNAARMETRSAVDADDETIDDYLDVERDPNREGGASARDHSSPTQDFFSANTSAGGIPDDWDDDFLKGMGDDTPPPAPQKDAASLIPETSFSDQPFDIPEPEETAPPAPQEDVVAAERDAIDDLLGARADAGEDLPPVEDAPVEEPEELAPEPVPETVPPAPTAHKEAAAPPQPTTGGDLARRFLDAAGVDHARMDESEIAEVMDRAGTAFRVLVEGAREVLMARASIKDELHLGQTMVSPDGNNPIKFSVSPQQCVEAMVKPTVAGYQPGDMAAREAMRDIKAHEVAMMAGMETAIKALLGRFDPKALESQIEASGRIGGLLKNRKAQYWDVFEKLYAQISDDAEEDFNALFGKSFAKAYKSQMAKLKSEEN